MEQFTPKEDPRLEHLANRQQAMQQGRNDSEWHDFNEITEQYENNEISAEEMKEKSKDILDKKQDYN